jgi:hypothetical protein
MVTEILMILSLEGRTPAGNADKHVLLPTSSETQWGSINITVKPNGVGYTLQLPLLTDIFYQTVRLLSTRPDNPISPLSKNVMNFTYL